MNDLQSKTAKAIVNVFETGRVRGNYGSVTLLPGDSGHLTYGRSQTTLSTGNLFLLIHGYCNAPAAAFARELEPFLPRLLQPDLTLDVDAPFRDLLRLAGDDPVMQQEQDRFFDAHYFDPACRLAAARGLQTALGQAVVYDSVVHGSFKMVAARVGKPIGKGDGALTEQQWTTAYVDERRTWLASRGGMLAKTVYRMDAFKGLIAGNDWELPLPLDVHGVTITQTALEAAGPPAVVRASARDAAEAPARVLTLTSPYMRGPDVVLVQQALDANGFTNGTKGPNGMKVYDGVFGPFTVVLLQKFQRAKGFVPADGIVGPLTREALGL
jgi:chitosanase